MAFVAVVDSVEVGNGGGSSCAGGFSSYIRVWDGDGWMFDTVNVCIIRFDQSVNPLSALDPNR